MNNRSPKILIIVGAFCLLIVFGLIWSGIKGSDTGKSSTQAQQKQEGSKKDNDDATEKKPIWDVQSGDTNDEVMRTLVAGQKKSEKEIEDLKQENDKLQKNDIQSLKEDISNAKQTLQTEISNTENTIKSQVEGQQQDISQIKTTMHNGSGNSGDYTIDNADNPSSPGVVAEARDLSSPALVTTGEGSSTGTAPTLASSTNLSEANSIDSTQNPPVLPSDQESNQTPYSSGSSSSSSSSFSEAGESQQNQIIPYYTIPALSTLNNVSLMTSIIGEVPVSGRLLAPAFPFKAIIGRKDLFAANGYSVPSDIAGMVIEGYSVGDMLMGCARPYVMQVLFVFNDGHFVVYPDKTRGDSTQISPKDSIGYLSDEYNNTCIPDDLYLTDAPKVIGTMSLLGGISGAGGAVASSQLTTLTSSIQSTTELTGSVPKYVAGLAANGASQAALDWYKARAADIFDAVFIRATYQDAVTKQWQVRKLVFNVTQTIPIDLNKQGRTLRYENKNLFSDQSTQLD